MRNTRVAIGQVAPLCAALALAAAAWGCGGGASAYRQSGGGGWGGAATASTGGWSGEGSGSTEAALGYQPPPEAAAGYDFARDEVGGELVRPDGSATVAPRRAAGRVGGAPLERTLEQALGERERSSPPLAQADTRSSSSSGATGGQQAQAQASTSATDAVDTSGPLLIYTATFHVAVYEVQESQARIVAAARELGGFVFAQSDDRVVVRVPAPRFRAMLEQIEAAGDVEHRDVSAQDVSEEFHDVEIRIRNLEAMRARVETLLAQARTVEEALQVEQQLRRITEELELLRGRQRFLADRVAFSTITVLFRPRPRELIDQPDVFVLPFGWLDQLGLSNLLELR